METNHNLTLTEKLEAKRIRPSSDIPPHTFLFSWFNTPCFARGELVALTGKAKSGKTYLNSILMTVCSSDELLGLRRLREEPYKVLWIDTEQSEDSTCEILRDRIGALLNTTPDDNMYITYNLRTVNWQERKELVDSAILMHQPDLVIFDGIRDIVGDINDYEEAQSVISGLLSIASFSQACVVCVLHQNKAVEDKTLRGALGTELQNKSFETYECSKNTDTHIFSVKQVATRKYDIMNTLQFLVDADGLPIPCSEVKDESQPDIHEMFYTVLKPAKELRAMALKAQIRSSFHIASDKEYGLLIGEALRQNIISKRQVSEREVYYFLTPQNKDLELNFGGWHESP